jgi:hypothetical protein
MFSYSQMVMKIIPSMTVIKSVLIIPCSNKKSNKTTTAHQLYRGSLNEIIKSYDPVDFRAKFELYYLSSEHGLIHSDTVISPYNTKMGKDISPTEFAIKFKRETTKKLNDIATKDTELYMVLFKKYQTAFDLMKITSLKKFKMVYRSLNVAGIGVYRGRLNKIIKAKLKVQFPPTLMRSGCCNESEFLALLKSNEAIGTSLAYLSSGKAMGYTIDAIKNKKTIFIDNGMITAATRSQVLDIPLVFEQYISLLKSIKGTQTVSIVIPDNPFSALAALNVIAQYNKEIKWLANKCNVIIPIHKSIDISPLDQVHQVISILGEKTARRITLGIPCRSIPNFDWRLPIADVESLLNIKDSNNDLLFTKVHFLALSEATRGTVYQERVALCQMYNVNMSADACRIPALFGAINSKRKGSVLAREVKESMTIYNEELSEYLNNYGHEDEVDNPYVFEYINGLSPIAKVELWNKGFPNVKIEYDENDIDEVVEIFERLTDAYSHDAIDAFIKVLKHILFEDEFTIRKIEPSGNTVREQTIYELFRNKNSCYNDPVQQIMSL